MSDDTIHERPGGAPFTGYDRPRKRRPAPMTDPIRVPLGDEWRHAAGGAWFSDPDLKACRACDQPWPCDAEQMRLALDAATARALAAEEARDSAHDALWLCGVLSGMDTDGDQGPGAMLAGMGEAGYRDAMVDAVRVLRETYDECLDEPRAAANRTASGDEG